MISKRILGGEETSAIQDFTVFAGEKHPRKTKLFFFGEKHEYLATVYATSRIIPPIHQLMLIVKLDVRQKHL